MPKPDWLTNNCCFHYRRLPILRLCHIVTYVHCHIRTLSHTYIVTYVHCHMCVLNKLLSYSDYIANNLFLLAAETRISRNMMSLTFSMSEQNILRMWFSLKLYNKHFKSDQLNITKLKLLVQSFTNTQIGQFLVVTLHDLFDSSHRPHHLNPLILNEIIVSNYCIKT